MPLKEHCNQKRKDKGPEVRPPTSHSIKTPDGSVGKSPSLWSASHQELDKKALVKF